MALSVVNRGSAQNPGQKPELHMTNTRSVHMDQNTIFLCTDSSELMARWRQGLPGNAHIQPIRDLAALKTELAKSKSAAVLFDLGLCEEGSPVQSADLIKAHPESKIIAMSPLPDTDEGLRLISNGAKGYCNRYIAPEMLAKVIGVVEMGEVWLGNNLTIRLLENLAKAGEAQTEKPHAQESDQRLVGLTAREHEIAKLVGSGAPNKVIASELGITDRTVKAHLSAIFRKTQTKDRLQLGLLVNTSSL